MQNLRLYDFLSRATSLGYRGKILLVAIAGLLFPFLAIVGYFAWYSPFGVRTAVAVSAVALIATLLSAGATLYALDQLLLPIVNTSRALRAFRADRTMPQLPAHYSDEVGMLMADIGLTVQDLDQAIDDLVNYDRVTGLPNHELLLARLDERLKQSQPFALLLLRATNYERVASIFDPSVANTMLRQLAWDLRQAMGPAAFLSRLEGGLFACVLEAADSAEAAATAEAIVSVLRRETTIEGITILPELAAGAALFPDDAGEAAGLLGAAGAVLAQAIAQRSTRLRFAAAAMSGALPAPAPARRIAGAA